jgi:hypothetical protein
LKEKRDKTLTFFIYPLKKCSDLHAFYQKLTFKRSIHTLSFFAIVHGNLQKGMPVNYCNASIIERAEGIYIGIMPRRRKSAKT